MMTMETRVVVLTPEELSLLVEDAVERVLERVNIDTDAAGAAASDPRQFVYGLRGIAQLFGVSKVTAQHYKNTFLAPAVMQRGKRIMVDREMALELFSEYQTNRLTDY